LELRLEPDDGQIQGQIVKDLDYRQDNVVTFRLSYVQERSQEESRTGRRLSSRLRVSHSPFSHRTCSVPWH